MDKEAMRKLELANKKLADIIATNDFKTEVLKSIVSVIETIDSVLETK